MWQLILQESIGESGHLVPIVGENDFRHIWEELGYEINKVGFFVNT